MDEDARQRVEENILDDVASRCELCLMWSVVHHLLSLPHGPTHKRARSMNHSSIKHDIGTVRQLPGNPERFLS